MISKEAVKNFDFESYIDSKFDRIYKTGKPYRIRTHCPFCDDEKTGHFYIHIPNRWVYCQKCKYNPKWLVPFLADMENMSPSQVIEWLSESKIIFGEKQKVSEIVNGIYDVKDTNSEFVYSPIELDSSFVPLWETTGIPIVDKCLEVARVYLKNRGVVDFQMRQYDIRYCYSGRYTGRLIVPCYYKGDVVTFVGRDITGDASQKYLNPTANKQGDFLFNYDSVLDDRVVVTEGVFDAIAIGDLAVASFGKSLSQRQLELLKGFKEVVFYWDEDAYDEVERYATQLNGVVKTVLHPDDLDAGARSYAENQHLIDEAVLVSSVANTVFSICR